MTKEFVLGMESLLIANATEQFGSDNIIIIPLATIEELESFEGYPEENKNAKAVLKQLREIGMRKLINEGFVQKNGSILKVALDIPTEHGRSKKLKPLPFTNLSNYDKRRFAVCKHLKETKSDDIDDVILISMNDSTRLGADYLEIKAEEPKFRLFPILEEQYKGQANLKVDDSFINTLYQKNKCNPSSLMIPNSKPILPNTFLSLRSYSGNSALGFYDGRTIKRLDESMINLTHGFTPLNKSQLFLLYSLVLPPTEIPIVIAKGAAGTGKTFCSLVAGFAQTKKISWKDTALYNRVLVSAPMLDEKVKKIGAVKGGIEDKLNPYTAGILDNANEILNFNKYFKYKNKNQSIAAKSRKTKRKATNTESSSSENTFLESTGNSNSTTSEHSKPDTLRDIMDDGLFRIISLDLLRGRTFTNSFYIVDEAQNIRPEEIKTLLTRIGTGSKIILLGDPSQTDAKGLNERYNGLTYASELLKGKPYCCQIGFDENESVRSPFVKEILKLF